MALWSRLCHRLGRAGLPRRPDEGPLAYARRAASRWPQWGALLQRIGESYASLRYGPDDGARDQRITALRKSLAALPQVRTLRGAA